MDGTSGHVTHCHLPTIPVVKPLDRSADARVVSLRPSPPIETGESTPGYIPTRVNARPVTEARFDHESNDGESKKAALDSAPQQSEPVTPRATWCT